MSGLDGLDAWLTTTPEDQGHDDICNCRECHEHHIYNIEVIDLALQAPQDFPCCVQELENMIRKGMVCPKHPAGSCGQATKTAPAWCDECAEADPAYQGGFPSASKGENI